MIFKHLVQPYPINYYPELFFILQDKNFTPKNNSPPASPQPKQPPSCFLHTDRPYHIEAFGLESKKTSTNNIQSGWRRDQLFTDKRGSDIWADIWASEPTGMEPEICLFCTVLQASFYRLSRSAGSFFGLVRKRLPTPLSLQATVIAASETKKAISNQREREKEREFSSACSNC